MLFHTSSVFHRFLCSVKLKKFCEVEKYRVHRTGSCPPPPHVNLFKLLDYLIINVRSKDTV